LRGEAANEIARWHPGCSTGCMPSTFASHPRRPVKPVLRWVFGRDANAITCELDTRGARSYEVCLVPHWNVAASIVERFEAPSRAFLRHAQIARELREGGWVLVDRLPASRLAAG
jgi:hypothetical protein